MKRKNQPVVVDFLTWWPEIELQRQRRDQRNGVKQSERERRQQRDNEMGWRTVVGDERLGVVGGGKLTGKREIKKEKNELGIMKGTIQPLAYNSNT